MDFTVANGGNNLFYSNAQNPDFLRDGLNLQTVQDSESETSRLNTQINGVSIHRLFNSTVFISLLVVAILLFGFIMGMVCWYRDKPHIQNRSPHLILMITGGVFLDTIFKLLIVYLPFQAIDLKCQMAIITRVVFHYIAYLFILFRILRVQRVNDIQKKLIDEQAFKQGADARLKEKRKANDDEQMPSDVVATGTTSKKDVRKAKQKAAKQERMNKRQYMEDMLEEARMMREERILTDKTINWIVPLTLVGLIANFIPYFLIFVPIEESGICWLYYLTRSPYQLERIDSWLYQSSEVFKYLINVGELIILIIFSRRIRRMTDEKIDIARESKLMIISWGTFSLLNLIMQTIANHMKGLSYNNEQLIAIIAFLFIYLRNISIAVIAFWYSVFQMNRKYDKNEKQNEGDASGDNLGLHAIDDFDTAMKSSVPVTYFRNFVNSWTDHTKCEDPQMRHAKKYFEIYQLITIYNLMQNKMNHQQDLYEKRLKKWKQKKNQENRPAEPVAPQIDQDQKDIIVQIMQMLDKNLKGCFPNQSQNQFFQQFSDLLVVPEEKKNYIEGISERGYKGGNMDGQSESSRNRSDFRGLGSQNNGHFDHDAITEERTAQDPHEIQSSTVPYLSRETDQFQDCFRFGQLEVMIPFERLDQQEILQSIDLTYYLSECRRILKSIYDKEYKEKHRLYYDLRQFLQNHQLQKNLIQQVFMNCGNKNGLAS